MATVEKRPLTWEEIAEAERLRAAWLVYKQEHPGVTQEWLGSVSELGSQGLIGQYMRGIIPLNLKALIAICVHIGADPREISPRLTRAFSGELRSKLFETISAQSGNSEVGTYPTSDKPVARVNTKFSQKIAEFKDELERAEREGRLTVEKLDLLSGLLRLDRAPSKRITVKRVLTESKSGQSDARPRKTKRGQ